MTTFPSTPLRRIAQGGGLFTDGDWIESPFITESGIRLIQTGNIGMGVYREQGYRYISEESFVELHCTEVKPGDLLISRLADPVGRACIAPDMGTKMVTAVDVAILRPRPGSADARFLNYYMSSRRYLDTVRAISRGGTRERISRDQLGNVEILLPSLSTQGAVADFLERETARIDGLIAAKHQMARLLTERWQATIQAAAAGRLGRNSDDRTSTAIPWLEDCPSHWGEALLKLVARLGSGHTPSRRHPEWWTDPTIPWVTTGEVAQMRSDDIEYLTETRERISELGMANSAATLHPAGTVVLCRTASAGYSAIMGADMATSQDFATWTCGPRLRPRFLLICLRAMRSDLLHRLAMGSTHKTIYMPDIESVKIPLPPVEEQDRLVEAAWTEHAPLAQAKTRILEQIKLLQERRQALITAVVTGQLDVPEAA